MAKYVRDFKGELSSFINDLNEAILNGSVSASLEDSSSVSLGDVNCEVRVYERYSWTGGNRVSLNITALAQGENIHVIAITSGGSQAMFMKMNTVGEEAFLEKIADFIDNYAK
jgi:hypothetical protein